MNRTSFMYAGLLLIGVFISAISQVMLKKASMRTYKTVYQEYLNPLVVIAYIMFVGTTFLSVLAYRGIPLSMGPILEATSYIYVTIFGVKFFGEKFNWEKARALTLIILGITIYAIYG